MYKQMFIITINDLDDFEPLPIYSNIDLNSIFSKTLSDKLVIIRQKLIIEESQYKNKSLSECVQHIFMEDLEIIYNNHIEIINNTVFPHRFIEKSDFLFWLYSSNVAKFNELLEKIKQHTKKNKKKYIKNIATIIATTLEDSYIWP